MNLYIKQFSPITFSHKNSTEWSALLSNPVYSLSSVSQTKLHTQSYKNTM